MRMRSSVFPFLPALVLASVLCVAGARVEASDGSGGRGAASPLGHSPAHTPQLPSGRGGAVPWSAPSSVPQYSLFQLVLDASVAPPLPPGASPYNASRAAVTALFTLQRPPASASAPRSATPETFHVSGFYFQNYTRSTPDKGKTEVLTPAGDPQWLVRFAPPYVASYSYTVYVDGSAVGSSSFSATSSSSPSSEGYVRVGMNKISFQLDSGAAYFAVGENMCWCETAAQTYAYDTWMERLASNGGNYMRLWLDAGGADSFVVEPSTVGEYDQEALWRIDYVLDLAASLNIRVMFELESYNSLRDTQYYGVWSSCPYNKANGGMLSHPGAFFTDSAAMAAFQQRLQYLVSRYAHSTHLLSWEFFNEVDIVQSYSSASAASWHRAMGEYLEEIDVYRHMRTTSFSSSQGDPAVDSLRVLDYTQTHIYDSADFVYSLAQYSIMKVSLYQKPHVAGEFGIGDPSSAIKEDPTGINLHNGCWAPLFSLSAGTGMTWWWDSYVDPQDLYPIYGPIATFSSIIPQFANVRWTPFDSTSISVSNYTAVGDVQMLSYVRALGMASSQKSGLMFVQNTNHTWYYANEKVEAEKISGVEIHFIGLMDATYDVMAFDTSSGSTIGSSVLTVSGSHATVQLPSFTTDLALLFTYRSSDTRTRIVG